MITTEEWDLLQNLVDVLEQFAEATDYLGVEVCSGRTWTWTSERLGRLEFRKGTSAWNSILAWAIKVSWGGRHPPGFEFHKGDALPKPGFRFGLLK
ncbi:hypothetical protein RIR_jg9068.t1 [Rhizophagus irregularis DAOM 181602=DAOM 197198]|nr:hypothetical protein RIR_jg9068.t1 [Rhizophagus irregularis DAOM 181602=DAOM 197198]